VRIFPLFLLKTNLYKHSDAGPEPHYFGGAGAVTPRKQFIIFPINNNFSKISKKK
jgi:hypothetical protein